MSVLMSAFERSVICPAQNCKIEANIGLLSSTTSAADGSKNISYGRQNVDSTKFPVSQKNTLMSIENSMTHHLMTFVAVRLIEENLFAAQMLT